jgi:hypothetical protein
MSSCPGGSNLASRCPSYGEPLQVDVWKSKNLARRSLPVGSLHACVDVPSLGGRSLPPPLGSTSWGQCSWCMTATETQPLTVSFPWHEFSPPVTSSEGRRQLVSTLVQIGVHHAQPLHLSSPNSTTTGNWTSLLPPSKWCPSCKVNSSMPLSTSSHSCHGQHCPTWPLWEPGDRS